MVRTAFLHSFSPAAKGSLIAAMIAAGMVAMSENASAQASFTGNYSENFDGMGTVGTAPPSGWSHIGTLGGGNSSWTTNIPSSGSQSAASAGIANNTLNTNSNAGAGGFSSNTQGYNLASSGSTNDRCLGTSPTTGAGNILQLRLQNNTGNTITNIQISYSIRRFTAPGTANELPGYWLFYSIDNGVTWTNVSALNPVLTGGTVNVTNSAGVTTVPATIITFGSAVAASAEIRFRWIDDNAVQTSPDQIVGLDNVVVEIPQPAPTVGLTAPTNGASFVMPATVNLAADASDSNGSVTNVEFFANGIKIGEDSSDPYESVWTNMISGSYSLTARATDNQGASTTSGGINITVTNPNNTPPTVSLTSPTNGSMFVSSNVFLAASASDTDGAIAKVEFFSGTAKLGEDTNSPFTFNWANAATGEHTLFAVALDNDGASVTSAPVSITVVVPISTTLISRRPTGQPGAVWKYLDNRSDQGTAWRESVFDDSTWASGTAPLGYGDPHISTTILSGPAGDRIITTYFRRAFNVTGAAAVQSLNLNILRDDGVVAYINGVEVARQNMPGGAINYLTFSSTITDGANETNYFPSTASPLPALNEGTNVFAVELHNRDGNSSDAGFDLELIALSLPGTPPEVTLTQPTNGAAFTAPATVNLAADAMDTDGSVTKVEFFHGLIKLGEDTTEPYTLEWSMVTQGDYILTARATDNFGLPATSTPVNITVGPPDTVPPVVSITSPTNDSSFIAPASILITADASDSDGTVTKVEFFNGVINLGEDTSEPYSFTWTNVPAGSYSLTARATDNLTATNTSAPVNVQVVPNQPPTITLISPADGATNISSSAAIQLQATVSDPENRPLTVTFYGRLKSPPPASNFTLVTLPDTQFYSENIGGIFQYFTNQTRWIVNAKDSLNVAFVAHMGDMAQNFDAIEAEYVRADQAMDFIEDPVSTLLTHGIPWGGAPGNHDIGGGGSTVFWNQYFGTNRWIGRSYWGGNYSTKNDNNYQFFSAGGMDFIVINLAYNSSTSGNQAIMDWADALLKAYPNHRAIITSHWLINTSFPPTQAAFGGHGQAVYDNLKDNPNLFLMLCGHVHGEGRRADIFEGRTVNTVLQDYQSRANGGDSWLRYFVFSPASNTISAVTYKTATGAFETDADSQFTLNYNMNSTAPWSPLGTVNLAAGETNVGVQWTGLAADTEYEWYAAVTDGVTPVASSARTFSNVIVTNPVVTITASGDSAGEFGLDQTIEFTVTRTGSTNNPLLVLLTNTGSATADDDYSGFQSSVSIPAGAASATLQISVLADDEAEGPETLTVSLTPSGDYDAGTPASAQADMTDRPSQHFYFTQIADPSRRAPDNDADGDGNRNAIEYFMGTYPDDAESKSAFNITRLEDASIKILFPRAKNRPDITGRVMWSPDLSQWFESGATDGLRTVVITESVVPPPEANPETIEATLIVTGDTAEALFFRLMVE